ncbi:MAG: flippase-like domain-containing protein [Muribaculaceae bacterium]|nr:flippase-like domain-containing protein [Muribaculaceae bacterium]
MSEQQSQPHPSGRHRRQLAALGRILRVLAPMCVSAALIAWLLHKVDIRNVIAVVRDGVDYRYLLLMTVLTALSFIFRGIRWGIQLRAAGIPRLPALTECVSIFGAYALNLIFTYLGEAWRCVYISRTTKAKISTVVGTDIGDRGSDAVMILLLAILASIVARPAITTFLDRYSIGQRLIGMIHDGTLLTWLILVPALLAAACFLLRHTKPMQALFRSAERMWKGFAVLFHMKGWPLYILLTFGIWGCYFMETYVCFWAFPFTRHLLEMPGMAHGLIPGLVVFVFGSFSIAIPSNGGLGPWNIAVAFALSLYGISDTDGAAYSLLYWSFQSAMIILLGIFSAGYIAVRRRHMAAAHA